MAAYAVMTEPERRVCMLCSGPLEKSGGIGRWAGYIQQSWVRQGLQPPLEILDTRGAGGIGVGAWSFLRACATLVRRRFGGRLGVVHANLTVRGSTARKVLYGLLAEALGAPVVVQLHSGRYFEFLANLPAPARWLVHRLFRQAAHIIVLGEVWKDRVMRHLHVPPEKITVLLNGVPRPPPRPARAPVLRPDDPVHIVLLGRVIPAKGVPELIAALGGPDMRGRRWRATIAGVGDPAAFQAEAARLGIADQVRFPGWLDQDAVSALLHEADILVLPSHFENMPVSVIEAMAHRVPVIATPVGSLPELLEHDRSILFIPFRDPSVLEAALVRLIDHPEDRARLAEEAHTVFAQKLDIDQAAGKLAELYRRLLVKS